jgi:hypothetical protein
MTKMVKWPDINLLAVQENFGNMLQRYVSRVLMWSLPSVEFLLLFCGVPGAAQESASLLSAVILMAGWFYIVK